MGKGDNPKQLMNSDQDFDFSRKFSYHVSISGHFMFI